LFQRVRWRGRCSDCSAVPLRLAALLLATAAGAQELAAPATTFERVVVTGSHIPQTDVETALPVQVLTREDIERSGVTTVEQLLERVPANVNPFNMALTIGNGTSPGLSSANLRGLGGGSTLVLLNGRRLGNYAFDGASVDLNSIPLAAIQRVEVLKDGASAIYGTDAIAGVINFILRKDFQGVEAVGSFSAATRATSPSPSATAIRRATGSMCLPQSPTRSSRRCARSTVTLQARPTGLMWESTTSIHSRFRPTFSTAPGGAS
jgi:outer membrane receptor protein involved in Fe transport